MMDAYNRVIIHLFLNFNYILSDKKLKISLYLVSKLAKMILHTTYRLLFGNKRVQFIQMFKENLTTAILMRVIFKIFVSNRTQLISQRRAV